MTFLYIIGFVCAVTWAFYDIRRLYADATPQIIIACAVVFAALWPVAAPLMLIGALVRRIS